MGATQKAHRQCTELITGKTAESSTGTLPGPVPEGRAVTERGVGNHHNFSQIFHHSLAFILYVHTALGLKTNNAKLNNKMHLKSVLQTLP